METFTTWYGQFDTLTQVFWGCAIVASLIFAVQLVLLLIGLDSDAADVDSTFDVPDADGDTTDVGGSITLFSVKNLINFLVGFGWAGVCFSSIIPNKILLTAIAVMVGCLFVAMFVFIYKQTRKLEHNGAFRINDCVGKVADVYLRIPAHNEGLGKVQLSVNGSIHEVNAMTDGDIIATGKKVTIVEVINNETVKVQ